MRLRHISYDLDELYVPKITKLSPEQMRRYLDRDGELGFVSYEKSGGEEPVTLLSPCGEELTFGPRHPWKWEEVDFIGAGRIVMVGNWSIEVHWGSERAERRFGRSKPESGFEECLATDQVVKDFQEFLRITVQP